MIPSARESGRQRGERTVVAADRIALVTGGNRGLGRNTAQALARDGADVVITYCSHQGEAQEVVEAIRSTGRTAAALRLDTTVPASFASFAETLRASLRAEFGRDSFDILVNNAGFGGSAVLGTTEQEVLDRLYAVHYRGVYLLTQELAAAPHGGGPLLADAGRIVNVSTGLTRFVTAPYAAYASMKAAVEQLTRYWAAELGPRGVTVNVIAPGPVVTDFGSGEMREVQTQQALGGMAAMGRIGYPEDIGRAITALVSEANGWITGQRIEASGGFRL